MEELLFNKLRAYLSFHSLIRFFWEGRVYLVKFLLEGRNLSLSEGEISQKAVYAGRQWDNEFGKMIPPSSK